MKGYLKISVLMICLMIVCSGQLIGRSILNDSIGIIAPKGVSTQGYVLLTYDGARRALQAKVDADMYSRQLGLKDSVLASKDGQMLLLAEEKNEVLRANKLLKRKLFWKYVETWGLRVAVVWLVVAPP